MLLDIREALAKTVILICVFAYIVHVVNLYMLLFNFILYVE